MGAFRQQRLTRREVLAGALALQAVALTGASPASAGPDSTWSESSHSALRLLDGGPAETRGHHLAAIVLRLKPGFKTYWRHPGDSGVPPQFQFEGSSNLKDVIVHFPAPGRFDDGAGGMSFGYVTGELLLPLSVTAADPAKPVVLRLKADYAVCEKLCVPANGVAELSLGSQPTSHGDAVRQAMATVPRPVALAAPGELRILGFRPGPKPGKFSIEIATPAGETPELFVEAPQPWFFEVAGIEPATAGRPALATVKVVQKPPSPGDAPLTLTLVAGKAAIEVRAPLDSALHGP